MTPQCLASFMWVVIAAKLGKLCLHHTHFNTSLACSAPLFNQCDCQALCLLLAELPGAAFAMLRNKSSPPSLLNSLIFSSAFVASLGVGVPCFSFPFHRSGEPLDLGDKVDAAATAAAKYGRCDAPIGDGHCGNTCCGLNSVRALRFGGCATPSSEVRFLLLTLKSSGPFPDSPAGGVPGLLKFTTSESLSASLFWPRLLKSRMPSPGGECIAASTAWSTPGGDEEDDTSGETGALGKLDGDVIMRRCDC